MAAHQYPFEPAEPKAMSRRQPGPGGRPVGRRRSGIGRVLAGWLSCLTLTLVAGCGSGGGGTAGASTEFDVVSGGAACGAAGCGGDSADGSGVGAGADGGDGAGGGLGEMRNVIVTVSKPDGTVLGSAPLKDNLVSLYPRSYHGAIVVEFADDGSGTGQYFDEALRGWVPLGANRLHVMVPALTHNVSANVLTEAAYRWALANHGVNGLETVMVQANDTFRDAFNRHVPTAYRVSDLTNYALAVSDKTVPNSLPNSNAGRYATLMAAQSLQAHTFDPTLPAPALALIDQLVADVQDDGSINASTAPVAYDAQLPQTLGMALEVARSTYGSPAQPPVPMNIASICVNPGLYEAGANWVLNYQVTDPQGATSQETDTMVVTGSTAFQGNPNTLEIVQTASTASDTTTTLSYISPDISAGIVNFGSVATSAAGSTLTVANPSYLDATIWLDPPNDYSAVGVFGNATVTVFDGSGTVVSGPASTTFTHVDSLSRYERVTTVGGTSISTCVYQFDEVVPSTGNQRPLHTDWVTSSGQGVVVKSVTYDATGAVASTRLLQDGFLNGAPVH